MIKLGAVLLATWAVLMAASFVYALFIESAKPFVLVAITGGLVYIVWIALEAAADMWRGR